MVLLGVSGYGLKAHANNERNYHLQMDKSNLQIENFQYSNAQTDLMQALKYRKNDQKASADLYQVQSFTMAEQLFNEKSYRKSRTYYKKVAHVKKGNRELIERANSQVKLLNEVIQNMDDFQDIYNKAWSHNQAGEYFESNNELLKLTNNQKTHDTYYQAIMQKVRALRNENNAKITKTKTSSKLEMNFG